MADIESRIAEVLREHALPELLRATEERERLHAVIREESQCKREELDKFGFVWAVEDMARKWAGESAEVERLQADLDRARTIPVSQQLADVIANQAAEVGRLRARVRELEEALRRLGSAAGRATVSVSTASDASDLDEAIYSARALLGEKP